jgi:hypothetical protein
MLRPNAAVQQEMVIGGLAEILFKAAEGGEAVVCMLGSEDCFESNAHYGIDGFTEKVSTDLFPYLNNKLNRFKALPFH